MLAVAAAGMHLRGGNARQLEAMSNPPPASQAQRIEAAGTASRTSQTQPEARKRSGPSGLVVALALGAVAAAMAFAFYWFVLRRGKGGANGGTTNGSNTTEAQVLTPASGCSSIDVEGVHVRGVETPKTDPTAVATLAGCANACVGHQAWTFRRSKPECVCIDQPFASDGESVRADADYVSGFYPTDPPTPWAPCGTVTIVNQRLRSKSASPVITNGTDSYCAGACRGTYPAWTRDSQTNQCYCIIGDWSPVAMQYSQGWSSGFLPLS
jgi:hypothetical protein